MAAQKVSVEKENVVAGTPVTDCCFLKPHKLKIQQLLQGNNFKRIAFNPLVYCCIPYRNQSIDL